MRQWYRPNGLSHGNGSESEQWGEFVSLTERMRGSVCVSSRGQADTQDREQRSDFFPFSFFPFKVTARPIYEQYRKFPFTRLSFSHIRNTAPFSPRPLRDPVSLPRIRSNYVGRKYVRSKSLFLGFGRLPRICSLTVHLDNGSFCHRNEIGERERERHPRNHFEGCTLPMFIT